MLDARLHKSIVEQQRIICVLPVLDEHLRTLHRIDLSISIWLSSTVISSSFQGLCPDSYHAAAKGPDEPHKHHSHEFEVELGQL